MIISRTAYGQMIDFLKTNPYITREEYMWQWTIPQISLAAYDFTHVRYISEKESKRHNKRPVSSRKYDNPKDFVNDLNIPIFKK